MRCTHCREAGELPRSDVVLYRRPLYYVYLISIGLAANWALGALHRLFGSTPLKLGPCNLFCFA